MLRGFSFLFHPTLATFIPITINVRSPLNLFHRRGAPKRKVDVGRKKLGLIIYAFQPLSLTALVVIVAILALCVSMVIKSGPFVTRRLRSSGSSAPDFLSSRVLSALCCSLLIIWTNISAAQINATAMFPCP